MSAVENVYVKDRMGHLVKILLFNGGYGRKYSFLKRLKKVGASGKDSWSEMILSILGIIKH